MDSPTPLVPRRAFRSTLRACVYGRTDALFEVASAVATTELAIAALTDRGVGRPSVQVRIT